MSRADAVLATFCALLAIASAAIFVVALAGRDWLGATTFAMFSGANVFNFLTIRETSRLPR